MKKTKKAKVARKRVEKSPAKQRCSACNKAGHNKRTCDV